MSSLLASLATGASLLGTLFFSVSVEAQGKTKQWRQVGPPTPRPWISVLTFDPTDARVAYAGLVQGGVARTVDGGTHWSLHSPALDGFASPAAIAVSPVVNQIVYVASFGGIWKSVDRGESWSRLPTSPNRYACLALDPRDPSVAYVGGSGIWRTSDGGAHWKRLPLSVSPLLQVVSIAIDPRDPARIYVGAKEGTNVYVARSLDAGRTWTRIRRGLALQILVHPADSRSVFTVGPTHLQGSVDGGEHWRPLLDVSGMLALDPADTSTLYFAAQGDEGRPRTILKSTDGGRHWLASRDGFPEGEIPGGIWVAPSDRTRLFATGCVRAGFFASDDAGAHWASSGSGFVNSSVRAFAVGRERALYVANSRLSQHPFYVSHDRGATWEGHLSNTEAGAEADLNVSSVAVSPHDANTVYAGVSEPRGENRRRAIWKSADGGASWQGLDVGLDDATVHDLAVDPFDGRIVFASIATRAQSCVCVSRDGGETWTLTSPIGDGRSVSELVMDPEHAGTLYAAATGLGLFKSTDRGTSWTKVLASPKDEALSHVAIAPSDGQVLYAAGRMTVFRSTDAGATWTSFPGLINDGNFQFADFGDHPLAVDPLDPQTVYGAGIYGVSRKAHDGPWIRMSEGLVYSEAHSLRFAPGDPGLLYVGTTAAGIFARRVHSP